MRGERKERWRRRIEMKCGDEELLIVWICSYALFLFFSFALFFGYVYVDE